MKTNYGKMSTTALMRYTYLNFPFYAINSEVAEKILNEEELRKVKKANPQKQETVLFTIGYEGISLEEYLVRLLKNNVKLLVDVRNNPVSMKYGFSKSQLKKYCESLSIEYIHFPEVGIQSEQRQELNTQNDYNKYCRIPKRNLATPKTQAEIYTFDDPQTIALTCFDANFASVTQVYWQKPLKSSRLFYQVKPLTCTDKKF